MFLDIVWDFDTEFIILYLLTMYCFVSVLEGHKTVNNHQYTKLKHSNGQSIHLQNHQNAVAYDTGYISMYVSSRVWKFYFWIQVIFYYRQTDLIVLWELPFLKIMQA